MSKISKEANRMESIRKEIAMRRYIAYKFSNSCNSLTSKIEIAFELIANSKMFNQK